MGNKKKKQIAGIFSDLLKKCSVWFLYIFIDGSAQLPSSIMNKRRKQLALLQSIDKWNTYYNFNQLVAIINHGIIEKYGLRPDQVLSIIYNIQLSKVSGIAGDEATYTGTYFDGTNWVDGDTGDVLPEAQQADATQLAAQIQSGSGSTFWTDFSSVVDWIVELISKLGISAKRSTYTSGSASSGDWANIQTGGSSSTGTIAIVVAGAIAYYLYTQNQSTNNTTAKNK